MWSFASSVSEFIHHAGRVGRAGEKSSVCVFCNARNKKLFPAFVKLCEENGIQCPAGTYASSILLITSYQAVYEGRRAAEYDSLAQTSSGTSGKTNLGKTISFRLISIRSAFPSSVCSIPSNKHSNNTTTGSA